MRFRLLTILFLFTSLLLCGCRSSGELENQAYVLVLGMDRLDDGRLELTVRVPKVGKQQPADSKSGEADGYLLFSGSGSDYPQALEALEQATPRKLNLSHIELVAASRSLAGENGFPSLIAQIVQTPHLYATARFLICDGRAGDFIEAQKTVIGTRLSAELEAMLQHYAEQGYIPDSSLAEASYVTGSIYGDAVAIRGFLSDAAEEVPAASMIDLPGPTDGSVRSPMAQRYSGTVLLCEGRAVGTLDASQTRMLGLIRGSIAAFPFDCEGKSYTLTPEGAVRRSVTIDADGATLAVSLRFSTVDDLCAEDADALESALEGGIQSVISTCQGLGADPFGFAECAAGAFLTVLDWLDYDWRLHYPQAEVRVQVSVRASLSGR